MRIWNPTWTIQLLTAEFAESNWATLPLVGFQTADSKHQQFSSMCFYHRWWPRLIIWKDMVKIWGLGTQSHLLWAGLLWQLNPVCLASRLPRRLSLGAFAGLRRAWVRYSHPSVCNKCETAQVNWWYLTVNTTIKIKTNQSNCSHWLYLIVAKCFGPHLGPYSGSLVNYVSCYWIVLIWIRVRDAHYNHIIRATIKKLKVFLGQFNNKRRIWWDCLKMIPYADRNR
jgi:hypothetical protein